MNKEPSLKALFPIVFFIVMYLGLGTLFEYILDIPLGFYKIPVVVLFLISLSIAYVMTPKTVSFEKKIAIMANGLGDPNIITMILIFLMAGAFVGVLGRSSAESAAYFLLSLIPAKFALAMLFIISALVSLTMGTSVGTITLIAPIALATGTEIGVTPAISLGIIVGGSMFGDNLSVISDTTIAACTGQGCQMKDKFRENFWIALPAAIVTVILVYFISPSNVDNTLTLKNYNLLQLIPYLLVLAGSIAGLNVFAVLFFGIICGIIIMLGTGKLTFMTLLQNMSSGINGMFETSMVAILVVSIASLVAYNGGFEAILNLITRKFRGKMGGMLGIGLLVSFMDIATANNTVAIIISNPIAKRMAELYDISASKTASLLDTFSCIMQGIIPYGAQLLVASSIATELGYATSANHIIPYLFYPFMLLICSLLFISKQCCQLSE